MFDARDVEGGHASAQARELLPANVKPLHYDLTLEPNFKDFSYDGRVMIEYDAPLIAIALDAPS